MKLFAVPLLGWLLLATPSAAMAQASGPLPRVVELLKTSDATPLKATFFAADKARSRSVAAASGQPGPQVVGGSNWRPRESTH
jgi:hypothetical protein